jgi:hypothetical protein
MRGSALVAGGVLCAVLACPGLLMAQQPTVDIDTDGHGNLSAAQEYVAMAWRRMDNAQRANNYNLGGHAERAKELLEQANAEISAAADVLNARQFREK